MYIKIAPTARVVIEEKFAVLTDLLSGNVFFVNEIGKLKILNALIQGDSREKVLEQYKNEAEEFISELYKEKLIIFTKKVNSFKDFFDYGGSSLRYLNEQGISYDLRELTVEIGNKCNLMCSNCNESREFECEKCIRNNNKDELNIEKLLKWLDNILYFGCKTIRFVGGNPLLNFDKIMKIIKFLNNRNKDIDIIVVTNGLNLLTDKSLFKYIRKYNITLNIQIMKELNEYSNLIELLKKEKIKFHVITNGNRKKYFPFNINVLNNREINNIISNNELLINQENFINMATLSEESEGKYTNTCMYKKLYIDINGECYPCLGSKLKLGKFHIENYGEIYKKADIIWKNTSMYMMKCNNCNAKLYCNSCMISKFNVLKSTEFCNLTNLFVI